MKKYQAKIEKKEIMGYDGRVVLWGCRRCMKHTTAAFGRNVATPLFAKNTKNKQASFCIFSKKHSATRYFVLTCRCSSAGRATPW